MADLRKLTILHSNDMHGDFMAENVDSDLVGGVSLLSGYVSRAREEDPELIYAVAGDMFRGSVIDSEFKGVSTIEIMNMLAPDVVTIGNHEVDYGIAHLLFIEKCAKFPIINANMFITTNFARLFNSHVVLERNGMKILFIGILTESVITQTRQDSMVGSIVDVHAAAQEVGRICNAYKAADIDLTVLLTHIGFEEDQKLAALLDTDWGVDLIIGGHSHTLPEKPAVVNGIPIVQAGTGTDRIGRFEAVIDKDANSLFSYNWQLIPINEDTCPIDKDMEQLLTTYSSQTDKKYNRVVTRLVKENTHPKRNRETELGGLFSDIMRESLGVDVMLLGSGSVRCEALGPIVTYAKLMEGFPYDDAVYLLYVTGAQLKHMAETMFKNDATGGHTEFYQFSRGVHLEYSRGRGELAAFTLNGEPIEEQKVYTVGLQRFHYSNLQEFLGVTLEELSQNGKPRCVATSCTDIIEEYLSSHQHLSGNIEGRVVFLP